MDMIDKTDGGSAFPAGVGTATDVEIDYGMTLRDWFAGQSLVAVTLYADATDDHEFVAAQAYKMADAMLRARTQ